MDEMDENGGKKKKKTLARKYETFQHKSNHLDKLKALH